LDSNKYLVHACLEGPEAGVYYRGSGEITEGNWDTTITLPDYTSALATAFTVHLTPIYNPKYGSVLVSATRVVNGQFTVHAAAPCEFDWLVYGKRGNVNVEPDKSTSNVMGDGPYKYIV
jgi:hypothetical protein